MPKREKKAPSKKLGASHTGIVLPPNDAEAAVLGLGLQRYVVAIEETRATYAKKMADLKNEMAERLQPLLEAQDLLFLALVQYVMISRPEFFSKTEDRQLNINGTRFTLRRTPGAVEFSRSQAEIINQLAAFGKTDLLDLFVSISKSEIKRHPELIDGIDGITITHTDLISVSWGDGSIEGPKEDIAKIKKELRKMS